MHEKPHLSDEDLLLTVDGELPADRQNSVRQHLRDCAACCQRLSRMQSTVSNFVDSYHALLDPPTAPLPRPQPQWRVGTWTGIAAAILLFLLTATWFARIRHSTVVEASATPNPTLTPGETTSASRQEVCQWQPQPDPQPIPDGLREAVFSKYGMKDAPRNAYEVDFLITPALGGTASLRNLWPEPYSRASWNAHTKDQLEQRMHALVCSGDLDLSTAQREIATNWVNAYKKYVSTN